MATSIMAQSFIVKMILISTLSIFTSTRTSITILVLACGIMCRRIGKRHITRDIQARSYYIGQLFTKKDTRFMLLETGFLRGPCCWILVFVGEDDTKHIMAYGFDFMTRLLTRKCYDILKVLMHILYFIHVILTGNFISQVTVSRK